MPRVIHFEIHAEEPERAVAFYTKLLGWSFTKWDGPMEYWMVKTGDPSDPGIDGGLMKRIGPAPVDGQPVNGNVNTVDVPDLDAALSAVFHHGGRMALDRMAVPGVGWLAYCKDTEGNIFGLMQRDPEAK